MSSVNIFTPKYFGSTQAIPDRLKGGVVAIGNFDGVHTGHLKVLVTALGLAKKNAIPALVLTFEPHPRTWFNSDEPVFRLTSPKMKAKLLLDMGFDAIVAETFDGNMASTSADEFITRHLVKNLGLSHVVTGDNFHFGTKRGGSPQSLQAAGEKYGFGVRLIAAVKGVSGETVSASLIRAALGHGDIVTANELLGRKWQVLGKVIKGEQLGRALGFPTANLKLPPETKLPHGIYAVRMIRANGEIYDGVASFGTRPTFDDGAPLLEIFAFDFSGDIYGEEITIEFVDWIRPELKFDGEDALVAQMKKDCQDAKTVLAIDGRA